VPLDVTLLAELRMFCRGLAYSSLPFLGTVRTSVRLPGDEAHERALRRACAQVAGEYGLEMAVRWAEDEWAVCFSRPVAEEFPLPQVAPARAPQFPAPLARLARMRGVLRPRQPAGAPGTVRSGG
jgi:hypothetical protein